MRRVVVTGLGCVSPLGNSVEETWKGITEGKSGIATITRYDPTPFKVKYAAEVKNFDASKYMDPKSARKMANFSKYAVAAAKMALEDVARWLEGEEEAGNEAVVGGTADASNAGGDTLPDDNIAQYSTGADDE